MGKAAECINLRERFGRRFRIAFEEGYKHRHVPRENHDPWMLVIPGKNGHIGPWGADTLVACTHKRGGKAAELRALDCVTVVQDGSDGINATFHPRDFDRVAAIIEPHLKPRFVMTPARQAALARAQARLTELRIGGYAKEST
jgi:hypothetical protein